MERAKLFHLESLSVVEISGPDATTIVHNLTTQAVRELSHGESTETFVTDVKGKMLGHSIVLKDRESLWLMGPHGQSQAVAAHIDRYIIREDATVTIHDEKYSGVVMPESLVNEFFDIPGLTNDAESKAEQNSTRFKANSIDLKNTRTWVVCVPWMGDRSRLVLVDKAFKQGQLAEIAQEPTYEIGTEEEFHKQRILSGFPWFGIDLDNSNLPQEADRDASAISFTKGCYLGQETIARLDAMGQVQKKLVRWKINNSIPTQGTALYQDEKVVGRLTSVTTTQEGVFAIGPARRTHFDPGSIATLDEGSATATVI
ncbi:MAG: aminomethyltransferase [Planctomycetota bacterium]|nr:aminomethyltransferase [Planctomycetota bacterium]